MPCPRQEPAQGVCEDVQSCGIALGLSVGLGLAVGLGCPFLSPYRFLTGFLHRLGQHKEVRLYLGKVLLLQTGCCFVSCGCCIPLAQNELSLRAGLLRFIPPGKAQLQQWES